MGVILVTGGLGFIGSHTSLYLLKKGYELLIIDSNINSSIKTIYKIGKILSNEGFKEKKIEFFKGDLRDYLFLDKVFSNYEKSNKRIDFVIHFAGLKSIPRSFEDPISYWDNNLVSSINLLKVMKKYKCKKIIFSSTATIYDHSINRSLKESDLINPNSPYGFTKNSIERFLSDIYSSDKSWKIANLRYFNPAGAHESGILGEDFFDMSTNLIPTLNRIANGEEEFLKVFGNDWDTKDGTCIRDFIHVMDLAEAHYLVLNYLLRENKEILNINVGTGKGFSVIELVNTYERVNNLSIPYNFVKKRLGDYPISVADNSLMKLLFNWSPKRGLEEICRDSWNYYINNVNK
tara:strand:+ start:5183 stop:6226 length:1044 start_codon:yes stop_codon:yes gene_type:complete